MGLPSILGKVIKTVGGALGFGGRRAAAAAPMILREAAPYAIGAAAGAGLTAVAGGRRKRRRSGLTMTEMGKIMVLGQALGRRSPAVTLVTMKALSGRI